MVEELDAEALRPLPLPDELTEGFWEGVRAHELRIQRCQACRYWNHVPTIACYSCGSEDLAFEPVSGRGTVHSWTVLHDSPGPGFRNMLPVIVGVVELEEQDRLFITTNLLNADPGRLKLGMPVEVIYEELTPECVLPQFQPVA
ncbi:MAG: hypothetical protein JWQ97_561 [Phenylobacterium sp.]|nr:hypothetical protein [Phenylobacterium sp.]